MFGTASTHTPTPTDPFGKGKGGDVKGKGDAGDPLRAAPLRPEDTTAPVDDDVRSVAPSDSSEAVRRTAEVEANWQRWWHNLSDGQKEQCARQMPADAVAFATSQAAAQLPTTQPGDDPVQLLQASFKLLQQHQQFAADHQRSTATAALVAAQQQAAQLATSATSQGPKSGHRQLTTPDLGDPESGWLGYERKVEEFIAAVSDGFSKYQIVRAIKDALPERLRTLLDDKFQVKDMLKDSCRDELHAWLRDRYAEKDGIREQRTLDSFDKFRRTSQSLREYIDTFEHHLLLLAKQGFQYTDDQRRQY
jgi:hypothetical protein